MKFLNTFITIFLDTLISDKVDLLKILGKSMVLLHSPVTNRNICSSPPPPPLKRKKMLRNLWMAPDGNFHSSRVNLLILCIFKEISINTTK